VPLLLLFTLRPDFTQPWARSEHIHTLTLDPLTSNQSAELFDALVGSRAVPTAIRDELLAKADGVPLFLEELTRTVADPASQGVGPALSVVPSTLRGLLASRLDRLSAGALEIHLASAFSRAFSPRAACEHFG
jgi:predicted ATPase